MAAEFSQARIRVNREGGEETLTALYRHEEFLLDARDAVGLSKEARKPLNRRLVALRRVIEETERTMREQGWSQETNDDEPQQSD